MRAVSGSTIISDYSPDDDKGLDALASSCPNLLKFKGAVGLYKTGLPVSDAALLPPFMSGGEILGVIERFSAKSLAAGFPFVALRYDHPKDTPLRPASDNFDITDIAAIERLANSAISDGWIPFMLAFRQGRAERDGAASVLFLSEEKVAMELVGPGHDTASISKGILIPPVRVEMKEFAPSIFELADEISGLPFYLDIMDEAARLSPAELEKSRGERRRARLAFLAGLSGRSVGEEVARLRKAGMTKLLENEISYSFDNIRRLFVYAVRYARFKRTRKEPYVNHALGMHIEENGDYILDDIWAPDRFIGMYRKNRMARMARTRAR
ncbi:MAG: hypothetical protein LBT92_00080 [Rickettsiales bacterium]|jgi:hypothetical protein|nr:hypothetical protein [Rickettsiales bacterium]